MSERTAVEDWGVEINEISVYATGQGADWWAAAIAPWEISGHAVPVAATPQGFVWFLPAGEKDDATWMRDHITSHGVNPGCVKVKRQASVKVRLLRVRRNSAVAIDGG